MELQDFSLFVGKHSVDIWVLQCPLQHLFDAQAFKLGYIDPLDVLIIENLSFVSCYIPAMINGGYSVAI